MCLVNCGLLLFPCCLGILKSEFKDCSGTAEVVDGTCICRLIQHRWRWFRSTSFNYSIALHMRLSRIKEMAQNPLKGMVYAAGGLHPQPKFLSPLDAAYRGEDENYYAKRSHIETTRYILYETMCSDI